MLKMPTNKKQTDKQTKNRVIYPRGLSVLLCIFPDKEWAEWEADGKKI